MVDPVVKFVTWIWPVKIYWLHDGEKGVITTFGKVRRKKAERGPGITIAFCFEEAVIVQALGGYIDLPEQVIWSKDGKIIRANGALEYQVTNVARAMLETEDLENLISGTCSNELREYALTRDMKELLNSENLTKGLASKINYRIYRHGARVCRVMLTDLRPHDVTMICDSIDLLSASLSR
jgi:regulator of protease activity HflC (stomatin/prohibitin superfamily)